MSNEELNLKFNKSDKKRIKEAIDNKDISLITKNKYKYLQQIIECSGTLSSAKENFKKSTFPKNINDILLQYCTYFFINFIAKEDCLPKGGFPIICILLLLKLLVFIFK